MSSADRSRLTWLFDLDNTLHNASAHVFPHINRSMTAYIERHLALDEAAACQLRQHYWQRYGATLLGLMRHHATDPDHFLHHTHQFPDLKAMLVWDKATKQALTKLPGRKLIFSNAPRVYTHAVLRHTGLAPLFDAVYTVERLRYQPKPLTAGFLHLLHEQGLDPRRCILVEDSLCNLVTAKKLGMKTVWVSAGLRRSPFVDVHIRRVSDLPQRFGRL